MRDNMLTPGEPILLATHGMKDCDPAVRAAVQLANATRRPVHVIAVLEPPPLVAGEYGFVVPVEAVWEDRRDVMEKRVRKQIVDIVGEDPGWPIEIRTGAPPITIANAAANLEASVIVMGLGHHHLIDRTLGSETTLHTLRVASTPIFAVPQTFSALPTRAIVAIDFSDAAVVAAQQALGTIPSLTELVLVHVAPRWDMQPNAYAEWRIEYERDVGPALERVIGQLDAPPAVKVISEIREGKTARELLAAAEEYDAQLFVVGSRGLGLLDRMLVGSTASGIVRSAQDAVYAFPIAALATHAALATAGAGSEYTKT